MSDLTAARPGIEPLWIPGFTDCHGGIDKHLDEVAGGEPGPDPVAIAAVGGDEGGDADEPGIHHEFSDLADASDVFDAVPGGEPQIRAEAVSDVVPVQEVDLPADAEEFLLEVNGQG